jgi:hypothetical protein
MEVCVLGAEDPWYYYNDLNNYTRKCISVANGIRKTSAELPRRKCDLKDRIEKLSPDSKMLHLERIC